MMELEHHSLATIIQEISMHDKTSGCKFDEERSVFIPSKHLCTEHLLVTTEKPVSVLLNQVVTFKNHKSWDKPSTTGDSRRVQNHTDVGPAKDTQPKSNHEQRQDKLQVRLSGQNT